MKTNNLTPAEIDDARIRAIQARLLELGYSRLQAYYEDGEWRVMAEDRDGDEHVWAVATGLIVN
jgi:hypothetical protein